MKKTFSVFILIITLILPLVSCGGDDNEKSFDESVVSTAVEKPVLAVPTPEESSESETDISESSPIIPQGEISLVVLGDSIARGYGLENVEEERFSKQLAEKLSAHYAEVNVANYGIDGLNGKGLVDSLTAEIPAEIAESDYVLVSIGANNVLGPMSKFEVWSIMSAGIDPQIFIDYFSFLISKDETKKSAYDYARESLNLLFKTANQAFGGKAFADLTKNAATKLNDEIPQIISLIKKANPEAKIMIQTVYNPYNGLEISLNSVDESLDLSAYGEKAVEPINAVIESLSEECGYIVVPVWDGFESSSRSLTNAGFDLWSASFGIDPHPNAKGHRLIADIYYELIQEESNA